MPWDLTRMERAGLLRIRLVYLPTDLETCRPRSRSRPSDGSISVTSQPNADITLDQLQARGAQALKTGIRALFAADPDRFAHLSFRHDDLLLDLSKCALSQDDLSALLAYAGTVGVEARRDAMFDGARINTTENRSVLHVALRAHAEDGFKADGEPVGEAVESVLQAMSRFASGIRDGSIAGATGARITDIVNIGIGGSDLGPVMARSR